MSASFAFEQRAEALRLEFDRAFAAKPATREDAVDDLLLIRISSVSFALRVSEIGGVAKDRVVVPVPSGRPELLGLAGIRGTVICVYDMAALLGLAKGGAAPPWLALGNDADPVGLAFHALEGFVRAPRSEIHEESAASTTHFVKGVLKAASLVRPIVDVRSMLDAIQRNAGPSASTRSRP
jgi:chemotaxis signal transduction protein